MSADCFHDVEFGTRTLRALNLNHPEIERRILKEMADGIDVYYDRHWPFTREFCHFLVERPELVAGRRLLIVGAGVGMEAVIAGRLADELWINDMAPVSLELQQEQLAANDLPPAHVLPGSFGDLVPPPEVDLVLGCFVIYDRKTAGAMEALIARNHASGIPTLLADLDLGGHFTRMISRLKAPIRWIVSPEEADNEAAESSSPIQVVRVG